MEDIPGKNLTDSFEDSAPVQGLSRADKNYAFEFEELGESLVFSNTLAPSSDRQVLVAENQNSAYIVAATDADGDALTYNLDGTDAALFSIDTNGVVTFNNAPDFENPGDANSDNVYRLTVVASDGLHSASQPLAIQVANENDVSILRSSSAIAEESNKGFIIVNDNKLQLPKAGFTLNVDLDQSTAILIGTTANGDGSADIVFSDVTGYLSFLGEGFIPYKSSGQQYFIRVKDTHKNAVGLTDGATGTALSGVDANLIFAETNNTPTNENDNAPVFTSAGSVSVSENQTAAYTAVAADADGDALTYSLISSILISNSAESDTSDSELTSKTSFSLDDAYLFSIDANTGVVTFNNAPDYENPTDADADNVYELTVAASDGENSTEQAITIILTDDVLNSDTDANQIAADLGTDTLRFDAAIELDFTTLSDNKINGIEKIDLTGDGGNSIVTLNATDVLNLSDTINTLHAGGESGDKLAQPDISNGQSGEWDSAQVEDTDTVYQFTSDSDVLAQISVDNNMLPNLDIVA